MARSPFLRRIPDSADAAPRIARALTAAGTRIDPLNEAMVKRVTAQPRDWQIRALGYYDDLGEVRYGARWMGDAISRLRVIPAYQESPTDPPVALEVADRPDAEIAAASGAIARLATGAESGMAGLMRNLALNVWLVGEAYLVGYLDSEGLEQWDVASVEALVRDPRGGLALRTSPSTQPQEATLPLDPEQSVVIQVMRRHPRWRDWPDSAMRGALEYCEDLSLLTRMIRATASSRVPAGMLFIPDEASFGSANPGDPDGDLDRDPLTEDLLRHMTEPIRTPGDAAAVVPFVLRMSRADIAAVRMENLDRPIDSLAVQLREEARRSLAAVLDLPAEIMAGKGDLNHWTAWQVDAEAFSVHVEPLAVLILDALSTEYYQQALDAMGVENPGRHRLWYDASPLVAAPDASKTVIALYDRGEVSGDALRAAVGLSEDTAPDETELERRRQLAEIIAFHRGGQIEPAGAPGPAGPSVDAGPPAQAALLSAAPLAWPEDLLPARPLIAAPEPLEVPDPAEVAPPAGTPRSQIDYRPLGDALARLDRELRMRVQQAADELARRALERAGNRLRSLAQKDKSGLSTRTVANLPAHEIGATLGVARIESLGTTVTELADGALEPMRARFTRWMVQALDGVIGLLEPFSPPAYDWTSYRARLADQVADAWAELSAAVEATVAERLITPNPVPPEVGEYDDTVLVPPGMVRAAIQRAWGGPLAPSVTAAIPGPQAAAQVGGLITSDMLYDMMARAAELVLGGDGWRWSYGSGLSRVSPFEPHLRLEGTEFTDWEAPALRNPSGGWPAPFFYPGDHLWCQCDVVPLVGPPAPDVRLSPTGTPPVPRGMRELALSGDTKSIGELAQMVSDLDEWLIDSGLTERLDPQSPEGVLHRLALQDLLRVNRPERVNSLAATLRAVITRTDSLGLESIPGAPPAPRLVLLRTTESVPYASYSPSSGIVRVYVNRATPKQLEEDFAGRWLAAKRLDSVVAHEYGHSLQARFLGQDWSIAQALDDASRKSIASADGEIKAELEDVFAVAREFDDSEARDAYLLRSLLSRYSGDSYKRGTAYQTQGAHNASEGFAELYSVFATPGGCDDFARRSAAGFVFIRALRSIVNDRIGAELIPDCS